MECIEGDASGVTGVKLKSKAAEASTALTVEGVFIYVAGSKPITDFLEGQDVALTDEGGVVVDGSMATNAPGVFAIGDIRNTPYKQVRPPHHVTHHTATRRTSRCAHRARGSTRSQSARARRPPPHTLPLGPPPAGHPPPRAYP